MKRAAFIKRTRSSVLACLALAAALASGHVLSRRSRITTPLPLPLQIGPEVSVEKPRLGRIRSHFTPAEFEIQPVPSVGGAGPAAQDPSDFEQFFARHVDPWFRRTSGWQVYNPDRLDRGQESARSTSMAFAAGLRYRHSF